MGQQQIMSPDRSRAMFRFTIRDVLWLTVVVALAMGGGSSIAKWLRCRIAAPD